MQNISISTYSQDHAISSDLSEMSQVDLENAGLVVGTCEGFAPIKKLNKESLYPLPLKSLHKEQTSYLFNQAL